MFAGLYLCHGYRTSTSAVAAVAAFAFASAAAGIFFKDTRRPPQRHTYHNSDATATTHQTTPASVATQHKKKPLLRPTADVVVVDGGHIKK